MILTTESQGLPQGPHHIAQMARNAKRIDQWRVRKLLSGSGFDRETLNLIWRRIYGEQPTSRIAYWAQEILAFLGLSVFLVGAYMTLVILVAAEPEPKEPECRGMFNSDYEFVEVCK